MNKTQRQEKIQEVLGETGEKDFHDFLINKEGELRRGAKDVPKIRYFVNSRPETKAYFKISDVKDVPPGAVSEEIMEFCGSWPVHEAQDFSNAKYYVNPEYRHNTKYSDFLIECDCGALIGRAPGKANTKQLDGHEHTEQCNPYDKLHARARLMKYTEKEIIRLSLMGWRGSDMAKRMGYKDGLRHIASQFNFRSRDMYREFMRLGGNTYMFLHREKGVSPKTIANIYDVTPRTLSNWAKEYGDYDEEDYSFTRNEDGELGWRKDPASPVRPYWMKEKMNISGDLE